MGRERENVKRITTLATVSAAVVLLTTAPSFAQPASPPVKAGFTPGSVSIFYPRRLAPIDHDDLTTPEVSAPGRQGEDLLLLAHADGIRRSFATMEAQHCSGPAGATCEISGRKQWLDRS